MEYRREIDGLRAIAVLPVILFHAGFSACSGGFVGVDIFFVISGYLITTIILSDMEKGKFSIITFYERRARRILPSLFFIIFCCFLFAWFWLTPFHMKKFSQSIVAVSAFSSNILFWLRTGYFDGESELIPLLHTWSLAVEEQFYLLFPVFLYVLWSFRRKLILSSLVFIAIASLIFAQWGAYNQPTANFYLLPARVWELAIGAIISFYFFYKKEHCNFINTHKGISEVFGFIGIMMIVFSIIFLNEATPFPSLYALIPTIGTGLIISFSNQKTIIGRFLGTKILVGIGMISYSVYLWHQPIFAFARHTSLHEPNMYRLSCLSALSIALGYLTWRYVENPFRSKDFINRRKIFYFTLTATLLFFSVGMFGHKTFGFQMREAASSLPRDYFLKAINSPSNFGTNGDRCVSDEKANICHFYDAKSEQNFLLVGDSHSADYSSAFNSFVRSNKANGWQMSLASCSFTETREKIYGGECYKAIGLLKESIDIYNFQKVFLVVTFIDRTMQSNQLDRQRDIDSFVSLIDYIRKNVQEVIIFVPRYTLAAGNPQQYAATGNIDSIKVIEKVDKNEDDWSSALLNIATFENVILFNERKEMLLLGCGNVECFDGHTKEKYPFYIDSNHLTEYGANLLWDKFILQQRKVQYL